MEARKVLEAVKACETNLLKQCKNDISKKYEIKKKFHDLKSLISYRVPMKPIDISEDHKTFRCPRCGILIESAEGVVEDYDFCYICGQMFKDSDTLLSRLEEESE